MRPGSLARLARLALPLAAGGLAAVYLVTTLDTQTLGIALAHLDWSLLLLSGLPLILIVFAIRSARWWWLLNTLGRPSAGFFSLFLAVGMSLGLGTITPVQSGEALKLWLSRRELDVGLAEAAGLHILERIVDVAVLGTLTSVALLLSSRPGAVLMGCVGLAGILVVLLLALLRNRLPVSVPRPVSDGLAAISGAATQPYRILVLLLLTLGGWAITSLLWAGAFAAAGTPDLAVPDLIAIVGLVTFATIVSLIPGGLGVSEASTVGLLVLAGTAPELALAGAIALRIVGVMTAGLGGLFWAVRSARRSAG